ncbi:MAG: FG-GAP-like repeat-containing protein [Planctomycetaceae bacterium]
MLNQSPDSIFVLASRVATRNTKSRNEQVDYEEAEFVTVNFKQSGIGTGEGQDVCSEVAVRRNDGRFVYGTATGDSTPFAAINANRIVNSTGPLFSNSAFTGPFLVGDFDGDGRDDIFARQSNDRNLWVAQSSDMAPTSSAAQLWGAWDDSLSWSGQAIGDFNGDGRDDYVSVDLTGSHAWVSLSTGTGFSPMADFGLISGPEMLVGPLNLKRGHLT